MATSLKNLSVNADELRKKLQEEIDAKESKQNKQINTFDVMKFKPELIGMKTSYVLRILPNTFVNDGRCEPWIKTFVHMFPTPQGIKKFCLCPTTIDKTAKCPLCEKSKKFFDKVNKKEASEAEEAIAKAFYKKPRYFVNVLVVEDPRPAEKSQKGKVLIFEAGTQIFDKFRETLLDFKKDFHSVQKGYNFHLNIKKKDKYPDYTSSYFAQEATPVATDDAELERISNEIKDLSKFAINRGPKSYEELTLLMEGKELPKKEKEFDSSTGTTTTTTLGKSNINENIEVDENPKKVEVKKEVESKVTAMNDDELMAALNDLES